MHAARLGQPQSDPAIVAGLGRLNPDEHRRVLGLAWVLKLRAPYCV